MEVWILIAQVVRILGNFTMMGDAGIALGVVSIVMVLAGEIVSSVHSSHMPSDKLGVGAVTQSAHLALGWVRIVA
jgi:hypothetical protein